jgi:hypothetical protein
MVDGQSFYIISKDLKEVAVSHDACGVSSLITSVVLFFISNF